MTTRRRSGGPQAMVALAMALAPLTACGSNADRPDARPVQSSQPPATPHRLPELIAGNQTRVDLAHPKNAVVVFWGSWCHPCAKEAPFLNAIHSHHYSIVGLEYGGDEDTAREAAHEFGYNFSQYFTQPDVTRAHIPGIPTSIFYDKHGNAVFQKVGGLQSQDEALTLATKYLSTTP